VLLFLAQAEEAFDEGMGVGAVDPVAGGPPGELGALGHLAQGLAGFEQCLYVDAIVGVGCAFTHGDPPVEFLVMVLLVVAYCAGFGCF
jgi:hypothetical protein